MGNKSQVERVEEALLDGRWHCTSQFYADYMADPRARMIDLKKRGYDLEKRPCKSHNYHDGPTKEWRIKTAPVTRYPFKVYIGAKVVEITSQEEEKKWRDYQAQKATVGVVQTNNPPEVPQPRRHMDVLHLGKANSGTQERTHGALHSQLSLLG